MSEEKINGNGLKRPGRPRKNVAATNVSNSATVNDGDNATLSKNDTSKAPRKTKNTFEDAPRNVPDKMNSESIQNINTDSRENKPRVSRGRPRATTANHKKPFNAPTEKASHSGFEYVSAEYVLDLTKEDQNQEQGRPKRKPGRPTKQHDKQPILSLNDSKRLSIVERERLAIEAHENLAISSHGRRALGQEKKYALEENEKGIPSASRNETTTAHETRDSFKTDERSGKNFRPRTNKGHNARPNSMNNRRAKPEDAKLTDMGVADFVAGVNGTSAYAGSDSLGEYGEKAALGVMGIIDEAPSVDALLPLVRDSENEKDTKGARRSRSRRRSKDKPVQKTSQTTDASGVNSDYGLDAPIAEGGELSLLEAEASIKKHGNKSKKGSIVQAESVNRVLYVSSVPDEQVEVVITENGVVSEYFVEMAHQAKIRGNIYKGIINNVDTNLQAAFVNFGCGKNGFLQIDEVHQEYWLTHHVESGKYPPIQKVLKVGQEVLVQVVKEPSGTKGAFLTTWISLAGRFIVLTPGQEQIGVSRKVEDTIERARLRDLLAGINPGEDMGVIIRTASEGASKTNIQSDLKFLKRAWKDIQKKVVTEDAPSLIYQEADLASRAVRDYLSDDIDEVWVDSESVRDTLQDLVSAIFPKSKDILKLHRDTRHTLWERFNILRQLEEVTTREVVLPSGGRLVFDQTEALMAIDINSGKTQGKTNFESMVFRTNMEAAEAIARHLRLRDIGGQVVIDFIEMRDRGHCREVEKCMRNSMKRDRARHDVGRLSSFGLLELVRQRTGTSAISISSEPCPHCRGTGFRRNLEWQAQGVLREITSKLSGKNAPACYVHNVEQEVAFYILNKKRDRLSELENKFNAKIEIQVK